MEETQLKGPTARNDGDAMDLFACPIFCRPGPLSCAEGMRRLEPAIAYSFNPGKVVHT